MSSLACPCLSVVKVYMFYVMTLKQDKGHGVSIPSSRLPEWTMTHKPKVRSLAQHLTLLEPPSIPRGRRSKPLCPLSLKESGPMRNSGRLAGCYPISSLLALLGCPQPLLVGRAADPLLALPKLPGVLISQQTCLLTFCSFLGVLPGNTSHPR